MLPFQYGQSPHFSPLSQLPFIPLSSPHPVLFSPFTSSLLPTHHSLPSPIFPSSLLLSLPFHLQPRLLFSSLPSPSLLSHPLPSSPINFSPFPPLPFTALPSLPYSSFPSPSLSSLLSVTLFQGVESVNLTSLSCPFKARTFLLLLQSLLSPFLCPSPSQI